MKGGEMEKAKVRTFSIAVFLRVHKVTGLPFPLLLPEVRHHVPLQLQLEPPVDSRVRLYLLLHTVILSHALFFALVQSPSAHERSPALLAVPGGVLVHRDAQQLRLVDVLVLHAQPHGAVALAGHDKSLHALRQLARCTRGDSTRYLRRTTYPIISTLQYGVPTMRVV